MGKAAPKSTTSLNMAVGTGVNGFGRIGRLVTRIMMDDDECDLKAINAGSATTDYMAYQYKYDTIHGIAKGTVEADGDFLILNGEKIQTHDAVTLRKSAGVHLELTTSANPPVSSLPRKKHKLS